MTMLERFQQFLAAQQMLPPDSAPTLLAVSGGMDSVVMAHLFRAANLPFGIAHCNFQLRGAESDGDADFVKKIAIDFDVPFFIKRFETSDYAKKNGLSTQMAARELRYAWFAEIAASNGFGQVATAHHLNDSVETALLNFVRGTGLAGLRGIHPSPSLEGRGVWRLSAAAPASVGKAPLPSGEGSGVGLLRPLLFATRAEIEAFARENQLVWREDSSNAGDDYARNFLRHRVMPLLEELNPNFLHTAERNMRRIGEAEENLKFLLGEFLHPTPDPSPEGRGVWRLSAAAPASAGKAPLPSGEGSGVGLKALAQLPHPAQALRQFLQPYGFHAEQARQVAEHLDHVGFKMDSAQGFRLLVDREKIIIYTESGTSDISSEPLLVQKDDLMVSLSDGSRLILMPTEATPPFSDGREAVVVDAEKLIFPLSVRHWRAGDSFQPFGLGGQSQKLQDFFTNQKISRLGKEKTWLLLNGDGCPIWVVGWRLDERWRVFPKTQKALKINWIK
jgi:tRNA(Ile)-lysidine synthase